MSIQHHPNKGQILLCDFSQGFKEPEMVKPNRPVVVLKSQRGLVTVVAMSTKPPSTTENYHLQIPASELPRNSTFQKNQSWLKGDMVYTVAFHRLSFIQLPRSRGDAKRKYFYRTVSRGLLTEIEKCVLHGIGFSRLAKHLD